MDRVCLLFSVKDQSLSYIRIKKHYIHLPYLYLGIVEALLLGISVVSALFFMGRLDPETSITQDRYLTITIVFVAVLSCCTLSMGVYRALEREGFSSMVLRTLVSFYLLGSGFLFVLGYIFGEAFMPQAVIFWAILLGGCLVLMARWLFVLMVDFANLKRRVILYGAGVRAKKLLEELNPQLDTIGLQIVGCVPSADEPVHITNFPLISEPGDWRSFVKKNAITEIVIVPDDRRRTGTNAFPLEQFLDCKLAGVPSSEALAFNERELGRVDISVLQPSWMLYSDGFNYSRTSLISKRLFDLTIASLFFLVLWPFMIITAIAVKLDSRGPMLYHQLRVGLNGKTFKIYKFRSMRTDAEKNGAVWASKNDSRVTRVGSFIRNTRLDELPQLFNVFVGEMSFVGPRPERPEFVNELAKVIPYYQIRHKVKPGLMGWAQLNYPYGATVDDAKNKLQYDLYYVKNHSFFMDLLIMIQTVEIILLGKGVH